MYYIIAGWRDYDSQPRTNCCRWEERLLGLVEPRLHVHSRVLEGEVCYWTDENHSYNIIQLNISIFYLILAKFKFVLIFPFNWLLPKEVMSSINHWRRTVLSTTYFCYNRDQGHNVFRLYPDHLCYSMRFSLLFLLLPNILTHSPSFSGV